MQWREDKRRKRKKREKKKEQQRHPVLMYKSFNINEKFRFRNKPLYI